MNERLAFGYGTTGHDGEAPSRAATPSALDGAAVESTPVAASQPVRRERADWAFNGLLAFTALLFFRPQEQIALLNPLHLAEVSALLALAAMVAGRVQRG